MYGSLEHCPTFSSLIGSICLALRCSHSQRSLSCIGPPETHRSGRPTLAALKALVREPSLGRFPTHRRGSSQAIEDAAPAGFTISPYTPTGRAILVPAPSGPAGGQEALG